MRIGNFLRSAVALALFGIISACGAAFPATALGATPDTAQIDEAINRAADFLKKSQADDGSFSAAAGPGVTAIVTAGLLRAGRTSNDPVVVAL